MKIMDCYLWVINHINEICVSWHIPCEFICTYVESNNMAFQWGKAAGASGWPSPPSSKGKGKVIPVL
jgi:hypothetical protein